jgi:spermidine synthase
MIEGGDTEVVARAPRGAPGPAGPAPASVAGGASAPRRWNGVVVAMFTASGAAGLIYQVVWQSQLVVVFGDSTQAIGTIVSAFMAGLGLGGLVGGLLAVRLRHPLRLYGAVECAVGALALLVPIGFSLIEGAYQSAYQSGSLVTLTVVRVVLCMATVTPVTFLMGMTLPLLTRHLVTSLRDCGPRMGILYGANTLGAMLGTLAAGYVLIELIGLSATARVAVALNVVVGALGLVLSLRARTAPSVPAQERASRRVTARPVVGRNLLVYAATFVSGFVALSLEVLWTRLLAEGTGSQVYIFVVVLAVFLLGIGLGGALYRWLGSPARDSLRALALAFLGVAAVSVLTVPLVSMWFAGTSLIHALVILPATVCMGYAFPLAARLVTVDPARGSRSIGLLYLWNTIGSMLGSIAAAFVLAATLGTNASILVLAAADAAVALALLAGAGSRLLMPIRWRMAGLAGAMAVVVPVTLVATGSPVLLTSTEHRLDATGLPHIHSEDFESTVDALGGPPNRRTIYTSGVAMTSLNLVTKLMAYIPKLVRPDARSLLDICFGMGSTFRSSLILGLRTDAVDLSPTVPQMMPEFYPDANAYLHSPLARVITADGRNYVRETTRRYDIITVDPPPPVDSAGAAVFYSQEFYQEARADLRPGGMMLEWLFLDGQPLTELREQLATFSSAFPHVLMLLTGYGIYMLGSDAPMTWDASSVAQLFDTPAAEADLSSTPGYAGFVQDRTWLQVLDGMVWLRDGQVPRFTGRVPIITDDHPLTEYFFLGSLFRSAHDPIVSAALLRRLSP